MARYRDVLPLPGDAVVLTDGGIETSLIYDQGIDLPDFAAFTLLDDEDGRRALDRYFDDYLSVAVREVSASSSRRRRGGRRPTGRPARGSRSTTSWS